MLVLHTPEWCTHWTTLVTLITGDEQNMVKKLCHTALAFVLHDDKETTVFSLAVPAVLRPGRTHDNLVPKSPKCYSIQHYKLEPLKPFIETSIQYTGWLFTLYNCLNGCNLVLQLLLKGICLICPTLPCFFFTSLFMYTCIHLQDDYHTLRF